MTMSRNDIRSIDSEADALVAIAADKNGDLYGITHSSSLVKIDKTTGEYTTIGPTGSHLIKISINRVQHSICEAENYIG
jgi:hypothetical protein